MNPAKHFFSSSSVCLALRNVTNLFTSLMVAFLCFQQWKWNFTKSFWMMFCMSAFSNREPSQGDADLWDAAWRPEAKGLCACRFLLAVLLVLPGSHLVFSTPHAACCGILRASVLTASLSWPLSSA